MHPGYTLKRWLKLARWRARRARTALRWGPGELASAPVVFGNAMPKSGSHLIIQVLNGLARLGPFVVTGFPPVNRAEDNAKLTRGAILENLRRLRSGDVAYGYLHASQPFLGFLTRPEFATVFVSRDPRDVVVSHVFYASQMHAGHGMHAYYTDRLDSLEARIAAAIRGVDEPGHELSPIARKYEAYLGWFERPEVLCLRFEDLILAREAALNRLLDFLAARGFSPRRSRPEAVEALSQAVQPGKSGTFRKGQPGNWREHFTPANAALMKERAGDLLIHLGYEKDMDWQV